MIHIHTTKEKELVIRQSFGTFTSPLKEDSRFFICNRGTIINMEHAVDFDGTMFLLDEEGKGLLSVENCCQTCTTTLYELSISKRRDFDAGL